MYAVKIVNRSQLRGGGGRSAAESSQFEQLELEVKILRELRHPNVVLLHEVIDDQAVGKLYIVQEFVKSCFSEMCLFFSCNFFYKKFSYSKKSVHPQHGTKNGFHCRSVTLFS